MKLMILYPDCGWDRQYYVQHGWAHRSSGCEEPKKKSLKPEKTNRKDLKTLSYRWAIQLAIEGDLRFLSHHDMMRAFERISSRAKLPLRYSQGFNPRPVFSLTCPRPVGVTTLDDRLVFALNGKIEKADLLARLNHHSLKGMRFISSRLLEEKVKTLYPKSVTYEIPLPKNCAEVTIRCIEKLKDKPIWAVQRKLKPKRGKKPREETREIDIKPMLSRLEISGGVLQFVCIEQDGAWARPGEVLELVGLTVPKHLAELVRIKIEDDFQ